MEPSTAQATSHENADLAEREAASPPSNGQTRRSFIKGVAAAGASTVGAAALDAAGVTSLIEDSAEAATGAAGPFGEFNAIAASSADAFEVPSGYRADVLIEWGDAFENTDGTSLTYGFNCDFLAYFPLNGSEEGLIFVNHEYAAPFFQHGNTDPATKTPAQIAIEQESIGNSVVHIRRNAAGRFEVVSPSPYNRRITGASPACEMTGPIAGGTEPGGLIVGTTANGSVANCSGGITPWGTALSCEENYADYGSSTPPFGSGWGGEYVSTVYAKYGWVVETDPYDPSWTPKKHTALGRFRHENTAFRHVPGKKFVLYMGDDATNQGTYKFVSDREFKPGQRSNNLKILESGTLYVAKWDLEGRRRFSAIDGPLLTPTSGTGEWVEVLDSELADTAVRLRARLNAGNPTPPSGTPTEWDLHYGMNRPEDIEVDSDGSVLIALTNYTGSTNGVPVNDPHGSVRRLVEAGGDPEATTFTWADYASGGNTGRPDPGEQGFSSCDNLVFDSANNLWIVTDISTSALAGSTSPAAHYAYHGNNALFMIPRSGPNTGVAFRFANMPVEAEGTGPWFTPDESTLFINVQHPGEQTAVLPGADRDNPSTFSSWWPAGNKTAGTGTPGMPRPSTVIVTKVPPGGGGSPTIPPTPPGDYKEAALAVTVGKKLKQLTGNGLPVEVTVDEAATVELVLKGKVPASRIAEALAGRAKPKTLAKATLEFTGAGTKTARLKAKRKLKKSLADLKKGAAVNATLTATAVDGAGNESTATKKAKLS